MRKIKKLKIRNKNDFNYLFIIKIKSIKKCLFNYYLV